MPTNRLVALLTPLFTAVAGLATGAAAKYGLHLDPTQVTSIEIAAATAGAGAALKWLHGHQQYERLISEATNLDAKIRAELETHGIHVPSDSELVHAAEEKVQQLEGQLADTLGQLRSASTVASQAVSKQQAAEHEADHLEQRVAAAEAAHAELTARVRHVFADPNLVLPDVPAGSEQTQVVPTDAVVGDVAAASPEAASQSVVAADVAAITPQQQTT